MKKFVLTALVLVLGLSFVACTRSAATASGSGEIVINFYAATDHVSFLTRMVETYNAQNPGIQVVFHSIPNDDYDDKVKVLATGSSEMDAFWIRTPAQAQQYISNNALLDLRPYIEAVGLDLSPIIDSSLPGAMRDGKIYGLPMTGSCWMLFYNKALFDAKGLEYPVNLSWDQYLALAKQLTYTENGKKYWGGVCPPWTMNLGASSAGEYLTAPAPMPYTRRYAEVLHRMYVDDKSHPSIEEMSVGTFDINPFFEAGNVYMMINGDWEFFLLNPSLNYGVAPMPVFDNIAPGSSVGQSSYFVVSPSSKHPKETYDFIAWCNTSPQGTTIYAETSSIPSYPTAEALAAYQKLVTVPGVEYRFSAKIGSEQGTEPYYNTVNETFVQEIQLYLLGEKTLDRMFTDFIQLRDEAIANYK
ncbi:MAG: sugar ABC transporter substrate-binding protein [Treponema sp.]|jgi:ABC-type glycerol-3-phosphate transport system substrate-binding protein|nr:sugar ABC transporter substrate-binding protein [Treponema sp.]